MAKAELIVECGCKLGEGPLWHPDRKEMFWFDIARDTLHACGLDERARIDATSRREWHFPDAVSVACRLSEPGRLLIAGAGGLMLFDVESGQHRPHVALEADKPENRSNDGRVHPAGTLWISTMGRDAQEGAGAIYAYRKGRLVELFSGLTIPNAICFSPDGARGYFTDTPTGRIMACPLDPATGLPVGGPQLFADTSELPGAPDGAVVDSAGYLWNARHGGGRIIRFAPDGTLDTEIELPVRNVTCPGLAGPGLDLLVVTSAREGDETATAGGLFALEVTVPGIPEPVLAL